jgi:hypothetical protein
VRRYDSEATVKLRYDIAICGSCGPILFSDSNLVYIAVSSPLKKIRAGLGSLLPWSEDSPEEILIYIWSRLVFIFTEILCIFLDEFDELARVMEFLGNCSKAYSKNYSLGLIRP